MAAPVEPNQRDLGRDVRNDQRDATRACAEPLERGAQRRDHHGARFGMFADVSDATTAPAGSGSTA